MNILVLAGNVPQIELMKKLKKDGHFVILADYTHHPIGEKYADKFYEKSTLDIEAIKKIAIDEKVDMLLTVCTDQALNTVAAISEELNLPCYIKAQTGRNVTNKKYMKEIFIKNNIPTAKGVVLDSNNCELPAAFQFPLIVKPVDCNSSKGVVKVLQQEELDKALEQAFSYSRTGNAIVEEFIEGKELSVDVYVNNGVPQILCVSESQKINSEEKFIIFRSVVPAGIEKETYEEIEQVAQKIVKAFNLNNCPMLIQMLYKNKKVYVIEFSARTGGGLKFQLIKQASGVDIIDATINATLAKSSPVKIKYNNKYIVNEFIYTYDAIFDHLDGFLQLQEEGIIENYFVFKEKGSNIGGTNSSGDRIAAFTIIAECFNEYLHKYEQVISRAKVIDTMGNDVMRHDLTYPVSFRELSQH